MHSLYILNILAECYRPLDIEVLFGYYLSQQYYIFVIDIYYRIRLITINLISYIMLSLSTLIESSTPAKREREMQESEFNFNHQVKLYLQAVITLFATVVLQLQQSPMLLMLHFLLFQNQNLGAFNLSLDPDQCCSFV